MTHGKIRERPRIESINSQSSKMIVTYVDASHAAKALEAFPSSSLVEDFKKKNVKLSLSYLRSK